MPGPPVELSARDAGAGTPIVFLHGLAGDHTVWGLAARSVEGGHRLLLPDLRGHGRTPAPSGSTFDLAEHAADVLALLDRLGLDRVHLVGMSAGGFLALQLALDRPERLRSLTVVASAAHCDAHTRAMADRWATTYREDGADALGLRLLKDLFYPDWIEAHLDLADALRAQQERIDPTPTFAWAAAVARFDIRGRIGRLRLPTLVVHGMDDQVVDPSHSRLVRQSIPGAELKLFAQTGHLVPLEKASELGAALAAFVARADGTP